MAVVSTIQAVALADGVTPKAANVLGMSGIVCPPSKLAYLPCIRYKHYVELVEPAGPRACIKCCDDPADCPTNKGMLLASLLPPYSSIQTNLTDNN